MRYDDWKLSNGGDIEETDGDFMETIEREYYKNFMLTVDVTDRGAIIKAKLELYDEELDKFLLLGPVVLRHHLNMLVKSEKHIYYISEECMFLTSIGGLTEAEMYDCNKPQKSLNDLAVFLGDKINILKSGAGVASVVFLLLLPLLLTSCYDYGRAKYTDIEKVKTGMTKGEVEKHLKTIQTFERVNDSTYIYGYQAEHPNYMDYTMKVTYVNGFAVDFQAGF